MTDQADGSDELDLTPAVDSTNPAADPDGRGRIRWRNWAVMGVLGLAAVALLYQALTSARVFFYNVDEAVARQSELDDRTFRMQGTVVSEPSTADDGTMTFVMTFGGVEATVSHIGAEPSDMFRVGEQVVAEGHWDDETFESTQLLVKHSEQYIEDNPDRVQ